MYTKLMLILAVVIAGVPAHDAKAGCRVAEIVKMARDGAGKKVIEDNCDLEVDDAPRCTFTRVTQLALSRKREYEIRKECDECENPRCEADDVNFSCSLGTKTPRGVKEGSACHCFTPRGPLMGTVSCNN